MYANLFKCKGPSFWGDITLTIKSIGSPSKEEQSTGVRNLAMHKYGVPNRMGGDDNLTTKELRKLEAAYDLEKK